MAEVLNSIPNLLRIEGHTDNVPINSSQFSSNWELSAERGVTVLRYLSEIGGLPVSRLAQAGFADTRPIADNGTPEGRALNRRADIVILYPSQEDLERVLTATGGKK